jgi:hypothetical protein
MPTFATNFATTFAKATVVKEGFGLRPTKRTTSVEVGGQRRQKMRHASLITVVYRDSTPMTNLWSHLHLLSNT